jgi:hypothetical protein
VHALQEFQAKIEAAPGCNLRAACVELRSPASLREAADLAHPLPEQYDLVVSSMTFHHIADIPGEGVGGFSGPSEKTIARGPAAAE